MLEVVWFKRDLRWQDHAPLTQASEAGTVLCLYVYEPEIIGHEEFDACHQVFINESLQALDTFLQGVGGKLCYRYGEITQVLSDLHRHYGIRTLRAHEETGTWVSYMRDIRVRAWCRAQGILFEETPSNGVIRRLRDRDTRMMLWQERMRQPLVSAPKQIRAAEVPCEAQRSLNDLGLGVNKKIYAPSGGVKRAEALLYSFLYERLPHYRKGMSSPVSALEYSSRLSPYLTWGNISIRQLVHAVRARRLELKASQPPAGWLASLKSFESRLHWHDHFIQRLESQPRLEFDNINPAFDGMREGDFNSEYFARWCEGQTGYPMIDACMRAVQRYGWLNFRMRALCVSFASYYLWLHWRPTGQHMGRVWIDHEPGIHWSQFQMQSGVTGINVVRIYSPAKQVRDQDPSGIFIRRWCPELAGVPDGYLAEPHTMPPLTQAMVGCKIGKDYPAPIVDAGSAYRQAKARMFAVKNSEAAKAHAQKVYERHGSRKRRTKA